MFSIYSTSVVGNLCHLRMWAIIKTVTFVRKQLKTQEIRRKYTILYLRMWIGIRIQVDTIENAQIWTRWQIQLQLKYTSESKSQQRQYLLHEWNRCYVCASKKRAQTRIQMLKNAIFFLKPNARKRHTEIRSKYSSYKRIHVSNVILSISRKRERKREKYTDSEVAQLKSCIIWITVVFVVFRWFFRHYSPFVK